MPRILLIASLALLAGCATPPKLISSNSEAVIVKHAGSHADAAKLARDECARWDKVAKLTVTDGWIMSFECVGVRD